MNAKTLIKLVIGLALPLIVLAIPTESLGLEGLTTMEHRMIALFLFAMLFWVLEPIPIFATSTVTIVLALLFMSNKGFAFARPDSEATQAQLEAFGEIMSYKSLMANFADPIIMLFLGGFFIGAAATKYRMDTNLGRVLLKPFGTRPSMVMLGMMVITAIFSMFMSNTATTAMMLAVLMPVLKSIDGKDPARIAFALAIPFAANIGGIGTPIGTPPNAVAMKYLVDGDGKELIGFAQWMMFAVPWVVVVLLMAWGVLITFFKPASKQITVNFEGKWMRSPKAIIVYLTTAVTIGLWILSTPLKLGMSSTVIAMIPVGVFTATGVINSTDLKQMGWDVLWLVAGGFALGMGLKDTGLSQTLIDAVPFHQMPALAVVIVGGLLAYVMASFMSNTATANLLLPVLAVLGGALKDQLDPLGGWVMMLMAVTFCCSLAMTMPISTPPNAMAYATGWIRTGHMARAGIVIGIVSMLLVAALMFVLKSTGFFAAI